MILTIQQAKNIIVNNKDKQFLFVSRTFGLKVLSRFFVNEKLIFESSLFTLFLKQNVEITFQDLPNYVSFIRKKGWYYSLIYDEVLLSIKVRYFKRPAFQLFENGKEIGLIGNPKLISLESRYYEMNTETEDENKNLYLLILFLTQLRGF